MEKCEFYIHSICSSRKSPGHRASLQFANGPESPDTPPNPKGRGLSHTQYIQNKVNLNLSRAVVISESEHNNDYVLQSDDEIAFVLPDPTRVTNFTSANPSRRPNF